jgi:ribonucleoside-diphosphate reductase alpha chain
MSILKIKKRDGRIVDFDPGKITEAIWKAAQSVGGTDKNLAEKISAQIVGLLEVFYKDGTDTPTVEQIQDLVEKILIENGHAKTAKAYIIYRQKHTDLRERKEEILGIPGAGKFSVNAVKVLEQRYLLKDDLGNVIETPEEMFRRVAHNIAQADKEYASFDPAVSEKSFYDLMINGDFLPNSPTLMNAGTSVQQLAACFVLPVEDSIPDIFETVKKTAIIQQTGGGTGFNFSALRPRGDIVHSTKGTASGPVSFIRVFDTVTSSMKEGGKRRGANMGILNVDHPDILEFIACKEKEGEMANFNISVGLTDRFMEAAENGTDYELVNPRTGETVNKLNAGNVLELIVSKAWANGEPGVVFVDRLERDNPTPKAGKISATNPCGEQPLLPHEACNLGSINVSHFVKGSEPDWEQLEQTVKTAVHFLDNAIDMGDYKLPEIKKTVLGNRKIGLGIMGFADMLFALETSYDSEKALNVAEKLMSFIREQARKTSAELGEKKGSFPNFKESVFAKKGFEALRNATVTTIAPTGSLSMIVDTTSGIEPLFSLVYTKHVLDGTELLYVNRYFEETLKKHGIYSREMMRLIAKSGSIRGMRELPAEIRRVYATAWDISPEWHIRMQAAFQKHTDNAVSKTLNFASNATIEDIKKAFLLAYSLGCKGVTVYRDESRKAQILNQGVGLGFVPENQIQLPLNIETGPEPAQKNKSPKNEPPGKMPEEVIPPPITGPAE